MYRAALKDTRYERMAAVICSKLCPLPMERVGFTLGALQMMPYCCCYSSLFAKEHFQCLCMPMLHYSSTAPRSCTTMSFCTGFSINNPLSIEKKAPNNLMNSGQKYQSAAPSNEQPFVQTSTAASKESQPQEVSEGKPARLILIDGNAVVYRAYYKIMAKLQHGVHISNTTGDSDWVLTVFTVLSMILQIFELSPSHIAVVFDYEGLTFRHTIFSDYKLNRSPTPDTVVDSLLYVKPALTAMGIRTVEVPGVEADDVIGTLAISAIKAGAKVRIMSTDKDFFQIVSPSLRLLRFVPKGSRLVSFGLEEFQERFDNLTPSQYVDVLALTGDKVDNIPGVQGIGEKTAVKLIKLYGNLENLIKERNSVQGKLASTGLLADKGEVFLSKRLVTLRTDLPHYIVPLGLVDFLYTEPKDGGERFFNLTKALGSFVDGPFVSDIEKRTKSLWLKY